MFRSSRQSSAKHDNYPVTSPPNGSETDKQKQKKRLSFKDPEVEHASRTRAAEPLLAEPITEDDLSPRRRSLEDLTFEERGLQSDRYPPDVYTYPVSTLPKSFDHQLKSKPKRHLVAEVKQKDVPFDDSRLKLRGRMRCNLEEKQDYIEELEPPLPDTAAMRCPIIEFASEEGQTTTKGAAALMSCDGRIPTVAHHQIQMLSYQLEQQRQQTLTAMHQIQLLKDHLAAESAARYKAQIHNHQLIVQNKELVDHIQHLFQQIQDFELHVEMREQRSSRASPSGPSIQDAKQAGTTAAAPNPMGYRRNSASTQSLWSNPNLLNLNYNLTNNRSSSSTALTSAEPYESVDSGRRQSIKEQPIRVCSPYDMDWRMRRRGSSTLYALPESSKPRNSAKENTNGETNKKPSLEASSSSRTESEKRSKQQVDVLAIEESVSHEYSASGSGGGGSWSSRYFKPIPDDAQQNSQGYPRRDKQANNSSSKEGTKKLSKPLEGLRLFNS